MNENKVIAFFDFDGTITNKDIFGDLIAYRLKHGLSVFKLMRCLPWITLYKFKLISNEAAKEKIFGILFKGETAGQFNKHVTAYVAQQLPRRLRQDAMERIAWHHSQKHDIYIVSANFDLLLNAFEKLHGVKHLSTQVQIEQGKLTGRFAGPNCYGAEKTKRIKALIPNILAYTSIYAYGDSEGDKELLELATHPYYRYFKG